MLAKFILIQRDECLQGPDGFQGRIKLSESIQTEKGSLVTTLTINHIIFFYIWWPKVSEQSHNKHVVQTDGVISGNTPSDDFCFTSISETAK